MNSESFDLEIRQRIMAASIIMKKVALGGGSVKFADIEDIAYYAECPVCEAPVFELCFHASAPRKAKGERIRHPHDDRIKAGLRRCKVRWEHILNGQYILEWVPLLPEKPLQPLGLEKRKS